MVIHDFIRMNIPYYRQLHWVNLLLIPNFISLYCFLVAGEISSRWDSIFLLFENPLNVFMAWSEEILKKHLVIIRFL